MAKIRQDGCWFYGRQVSGMLAPWGCGKSVFAAHNRRECRSRSTRSPQRSGLLWLACALAAMGIAPAQAQTSWPKGAYAYAAPIRDSAGNLYGTTGGGGTAGFGAKPGGVS